MSNFILCWLFPTRRYFPIKVTPPGFNGCIMNWVGVQLNWKDRLRVLVSGRLQVGSRIYTDFLVVATEADSTHYVEPPQ